MPGEAALDGDVRHELSTVSSGRPSRLLGGCAKLTCCSMVEFAPLVAQGQAMALVASAEGRAAAPGQIWLFRIGAAGRDRIAMTSNG